MKSRKIKTEKNKKTCVATFCQKLKALTLRNLERLNVPKTERAGMLKFELKNCKKGYCNVGCKNIGFKGLSYRKNIKNSFHKNINSKTLKSLGALSGCFSANPLIIGSPTEKKKGWNILSDFT